MALEPIQARNLNTQVYQQLKSELITGQFAPGQVLLVRDLAEKLGTSPMPIRQSLSRLVSEHALVEDDKFRASVRVPELSARVFQELRAVRRLVEAEAAALAAQNASAAAIKKMHALNTAIKKAVHDQNATKAIQANYDFHFAIYGLAGSTILMRTIESLWLQSGPYFRALIETLFESVNRAETGKVAQVGVEAALARNDEIISALEAGDSAAAGRALANDIDRTAEFFLSTMNESSPAAARASKTKGRKAA